MDVTIHEPAPDGTSIPEAFVHDLWRFRRFDACNLTTTEGEPVQVLDPGRPNTDAGADFGGARLRVGDLDWHGDVEIHVTSGTWFDHGHHSDPRYNRVILHVTLHPDVWTGTLHRADGTRIPEVVLAPRLEAPLRPLLRAFYTRADPDALPCTTHWADVPTPLRARWIRHLGRIRMQAKRDRLDANRPLGALLHERLFAGLGYAKNDVPMTLLAERLPLSTVCSLDAPRDRLALHLGTAGLLPTPADLLGADRATADYAMDLRARYDRLQARLGIPALPATMWTYFRLRPNNFPPLRIAQAVAWMNEGGLLHGDPLAALRRALRAEAPEAALRDRLTAQPDAFWKTHYRLEKSGKPHDPALGRTRINTLLVNAVLPILALDADRRSDTAQADVVDAVLRRLPPGRDTVLRRFRALGTRPDHALDAQGLHALYRDYCAPGRCLQCAVGKWIVGEGTRSEEHGARGDGDEPDA